MPFSPRIQTNHNLGYMPTIAEGTYLHFRDSFGLAALDTDKWRIAQNVGPMTLTHSGNNTFAIATGTASGNVCDVIANTFITMPCRLVFMSNLSQRIANQEFRVELVAINPTTGALDETMKVGFNYTSTTATTCAAVVRNGGAAETSTNFTCSTSASDNVIEMIVSANRVTWATSVANPAAARTNRTQHEVLLPDPNLTYALRLRAINTGVAGSTTTWNIKLVSIHDWAEQVVEVVGGSGTLNPVQAVPVTPVTSAAALDVATVTIHSLDSAATTNATSVKTTPGSITSLQLTNLNAATRFFKLYQKASAPTVGTDIPVMTIPIPATSHVTVPIGPLGLRIGTGIAYALTTGMSNADAVAVGAGDVKVYMTYI